MTNETRELAVRLAKDLWGDEYYDGGNLRIIHAALLETRRKALEECAVEAERLFTECDRPAYYCCKEGSYAADIFRARIRALSDTKPNQGGE